MYTRHKKRETQVCWGSKRTHPGAAMHWHEFYEVEYLYEGNAYQLINGLPYDITNGYLTFLSPLDFHYHEPTDDRKLNLGVCDIREDAIPGELKELLEIYKPPYLLKLEPDSAIVKLLDLFDYKFNTERDEVSSKYISHLLISLIIDDVKNGKNLIQPSASRPNDEQLTSIRLVMEYISSSLGEKLTRDAIAEKFNYSPNYLSKLFKKVSGMSLFDYVISARMDKARKLARDTDIPIGDIIKACGYNSPSLFYKHYYNHFKTKPYPERNATAKDDSAHKSNAEISDKNK